MKDYFAWQGTLDITGSRDATREAFGKGLVAEGEGWMEMIRSRQQALHTCYEKVADEITRRIIGTYHPLFVAFHDRMEALRSRQ